MIPQDCKSLCKLPRSHSPRGSELVEHIRKWGKNYEVDNVQWSEELLLASCDEDFCNKIKEQYCILDDIQKGGPMVSYLMMSAITSSTEEATWALLDHVTFMQISKLQGENIHTVISRLRGAIMHLKLINCVLQDIQSQLLPIFQTTSVANFNDTFWLMELNLRVDWAHYSCIYTEEHILSVAENTHLQWSSPAWWLERCFRPRSSFKQR